MIINDKVLGRRGEILASTLKEICRLVPRSTLNSGVASCLGLAPNLQFLD